MLLLVILAGMFTGQLNAVIYDTYTGKPATKAQLRLYKERNNTQYCAVSIKPCDPNEWKRVDGSCNNLNHPSRGAPPTRTNRLLTPDFSVDYEPRKTKSDEELPLARYLRTECLQEGKVNDLSLTQLLSYYILFGLGDLDSIHDVLNVIENTTNCCTPEGKCNYACTPVKIPVDDPVHRYSGVRCQNLTRPQSFQYFGCAAFGTTFARIIFATPTYDLSTVYGYSPNSMKHLRLFNKGLLKYDSKTLEQTSKMFPAGVHTEAFNRKHCRLNVYPKESLCYKYLPNTVLGSTLFLVMYYRQHNYIANELHKLNPCWDDERLFYTARDINIAIHMQTYFYEALPIVLGRKNMIKEGIISCSHDHRDLYDENLIPQVSDEFVYANRWFHNIQEATMEFYDVDGAFLRTYPMVNVSQRQGFLVADDNMEKILRGSYRQPSGKFDHTIDYDIAERILGGDNFMSDVVTSDLERGRYFGFPPYIKYREYCGEKQYESFNDLKDVMREERIYQLKRVYEDIEDVDLMAGLWSESHISGGKVPHTVYCLMTEQLKRSIAYDRFWFESKNRPHAFTKQQLRAIKKVTVAGTLCTNGNIRSKIQPKAFFSIHKEQNPLVECSSSKIGKLDLSSWKDPECNENSTTEHTTVTTSHCIL